MSRLRLTPLLAACVNTNAPTPEPQCPAGEILDEKTCVPEECGTSTWGNIPLTDDTIHVDADALDGGDGSANEPLQSIQAGVDLAAQNGGLVAIAAGTYAESIAMDDAHDGVTLAGRCRALVTIDGSEGKPKPAIQLIGSLRQPEISLSGLTITRGQTAGLWVQHAGITASHIDLRENNVLGLLVAVGSATLDNVGIYDTQLNTRGQVGRGIDAEAGADVSITDSIIQGNHEDGLYAANAGTTVSLVNTHILDTLSLENHASGRGLEVVGGASLTVDGCTIEGNTDVGVRVADVGTNVTLQNTSVRGTLPLADGSNGLGIEVSAGATLTATDCVIDGNSDGGVVVGNSGTTVSLFNTQVIDTSTPTHDGGVGIDVSHGASLSATNCLVQRNRSAGVLSDNPGTHVTLTDTRVLDTRANADGTSGVGIATRFGGALTATGCTIEGNTFIGVAAANDDTTVNLRNTTIAGTHPNRLGLGGVGLDVEDGARMDVSLCSVRANSANGGFVADAGSILTLADSEVLDTLATADGVGGRGLTAARGAALTLTRTTVQRNVELGVLLTGRGTTGQIIDSHILDTRRGPHAAFAVGTNAQDRATLQASGTEIARTEGPGLYVVAKGEANMTDLTLRENHFAGVLVAAGTAQLARTTIADTSPDAEWGGGFGIYTTARFGISSLSLTDSSIGPHDYAAIWLDGVGAYDIENNVLSGSEGIVLQGRPAHGNALFAENGVTPWNGSMGLYLAENTLYAAGRVAVLLHGASASIEGNEWSNNTVDLVQQRCVDGVSLLSSEELAEIPVWKQCPAADSLVDTSVDYTSLYEWETEPK